MTDHRAQSSSGPEPLIVVDNLSVRYRSLRDRTDLIALRDVNLKVRKGEFITVVGPSGCGKTTLLSAIAGLIQPHTGDVKVKGERVAGPGSDRAVVFQNYALFPWRTVEANVRFGLEFQNERLEKRKSKRERESWIRSQVQSHIELVGLAGFERSFPYELSGGMQQRVGLARALVADPDVLLADEPFGAIDAMTREAMTAELERIIAKTGQTVVFITHSIDEAIILGDRIVVISHRPGTIAKIIDVNLPRPRAEHDIKGDPEYLRLREEVWGLLKDEALGARRVD